MRGSRNFRRGCWGPGLIDKKVLTTFLSLVLKGLFQGKLLNFKVPRRGSNIFQGAHFSRGVQLLILMETYRTCDLPGSPNPLPHQDLLMFTFRSCCNCFPASPSISRLGKDSNFDKTEKQVSMIRKYHNLTQ